MKLIDFHFINKDNRVKAYKIKIPYMKNKDTIKELRQKTAQLLGISPESIKIIQMNYSSIADTISDEDMI